MSWRSNATMTSSNAAPLGPRRRGFTDDPQQPQPQAQEEDTPRGRPSSRWDDQPSVSEPPKEEPRQKRSRWGTTDAGAPPTIPGLPTAIVNSALTPQQLENYANKLRIQEIENMLASRNYVPQNRHRSPSPPPQYDQFGKRTNTREQRYKIKLEQERLALIERALAADPTYRPPADYAMQKKQHKPTEKVYFPVKEFPEIKFFGLVVGPRGSTLKKLEAESGAKVKICGRGSVKEGKLRPGETPVSDNEEMHCVVTADTYEKVARCVVLINEIITTAASTPEHLNTMKRDQLRELARLHGTFRDDESQHCQNCGEAGHRKYDCMNTRVVHANITCRVCGQNGHMARDCKQSGRGGPQQQDGNADTGLDSEYANLMAELNGGGGGSGRPSAGALTGGSGGASAPMDAAGRKIPPWRDPNQWLSNQQQQQVYQQQYGMQYGQQGMDQYQHANGGMQNQYYGAQQGNGGYGGYGGY